MEGSDKDGWDKAEILLRPAGALVTACGTPAGMWSTSSGELGQAPARGVEAGAGGVAVAALL